MQSEAFPVPPCSCPHCGKKMNLTSNAYGKEGAPKPNDFTICIGCAGLMVFTDTMGVREPTADEYHEARTRKDVQHVMSTVQKVIAKRKIVK